MFSPVYDIYYDICVYATHGTEVGWRKEEDSGRRKEGKAGGQETTKGQEMDKTNASLL